MRRLGEDRRAEAGKKRRGERPERAAGGAVNARQILVGGANRAALAPLPGAVVGLAGLSGGLARTSLDSPATGCEASGFDEASRIFISAAQWAVRSALRGVGVAQWAVRSALRSVGR